MTWGIKPPPGASASWCCRATYQPKAVLDVQWYRQTHFGREREVNELAAWVLEKGLEKIRKKVFELNIKADEDREEVFEIEEHTILVNPKKSYGYLYIGVWRTP